MIKGVNIVDSIILKRLLCQVYGWVNFLAHFCILRLILELFDVWKVDYAENFYRDMKESIYNTASYFKYDYEDYWIVDPFVKDMIYDVDKSVVLDSGVIDSPVLGKIPPIGLLGGVKTLILVKFEKDKIFNTSTCGDNCAKWFLKIAEKEDRTINLHHLMDFGKEGFDILILNTNQIVHTKMKLVSIAGEFV